jgi:hypothetical protein
MALTSVAVSKMNAVVPINTANRTVKPTARDSLPNIGTGLALCCIADPHLTRFRNVSFIFKKGQYTERCTTQGMHLVAAVGHAKCWNG